MKPRDLYFAYLPCADKVPSPDLEALFRNSEVGVIYPLVAYNNREFVVDSILGTFDQGVERAILVLAMPIGNRQYVRGLLHCPDDLLALHAIGFLDQADRQHRALMMRIEWKKGGENGINYAVDFRAEEWANLE